MSEKLKILVEKANRKRFKKEEDAGTVADLGPAPTGHFINKKDDEKGDAND